jgi:cell filamentation protein
MAKDDSFFSDPHFDDEHGILANCPGFTEGKKLDRFERIRTAKSILNLETYPVEGRFDVARLKEIHRLIFREVFPWAGEFRKVDMHRAASYPFAVVRFMEANLERTFAKLASESHLKGLDAGAFAGRAAYYLGELNSIHPFREGNGRTQREFIRELAAEAGFRINWSRVSRKEMYDASIESHNRGKSAAFSPLIAAAIEPARTDL